MLQSPYFIFPRKDTLSSWSLLIPAVSAELLQSISLRERATHVANLINPGLCRTLICEKPNGFKIRTVVTTVRIIMDLTFAPAVVARRSGDVGMIFLSVTNPCKSCMDEPVSEHPMQLVTEKIKLLTNSDNSATI